MIGRSGAGLAAILVATTSLLVGCESERRGAAADPAGAQGEAGGGGPGGGGAGDDDGAQDGPGAPGGEGEGEGEGDGASAGPGEGEGEGEGEREGPPLRPDLAVRPDRAELRTAPGEGATLAFRLVRLRPGADGGGEVEIPGAAWSLSDPTPGAIDPATGVFTAGDLGGATIVRASTADGAAETELAVRVVRTLVARDVPDGAADTFAEDAAGPAAELLYPAPGTMFPQNIDGVRFQWRAGIAGAVHRLRFRRAFRDVEVFTTAEAWEQHGGDIWQAVVTEGRIGWVDVTVTPDGGAPSAAHGIAFSTAEVFGAIYYWSTTDAGIMRLPIGDQTPERFRVPPGAPIECVGCHAVSRDGFKLAATHTFGIPTLGNLEVLRTSDPANPLVPSSRGLKGFYPTFSPDGTRLVGGSNGVLIERMADTGAEVARAPLPDRVKAIYPDWSPRGDRLVASGTDGLFMMDFGVAAADLWLWDRDAGLDGWVNPRPIVPRSAPDESNYYPAWSPDGRFVAFNRGGGASGSEASDAPLLLVRADAVGEAAGAEPVELLAAGRSSAPPFDRQAGGSWPKWSPGAGPHMWIAFSSTRPYGHTPTSGPQIWIAAIDPAVAVGGADPSHAAFWLPYQSTASGNHIPYWARYEKE